jgi:3-hydroxyisobutyrate dehydrogenase-like beta-hydroxyacid dehydrogenase
MGPRVAALRVGVLGLGEAGARLAADLAAAGAEVAGWDPAAHTAPAGVTLAAGPLDAAAGAELVLSVNTAAAAVAVAREVSSALAPGSVYADLNTAAAETKAEAARAVEPTGALFADVALMAPVPARGLRTPCLVSGPGAAAYAARCEELGVPVEIVAGGPGAASTRKLLRSVFAKGLAAAAIEALAAARAAGCEPWLHGEIAATLDDADAALLTRLVEGSRVHARRRVDEMEAAADLLRSLGIEPRVAEAAAGWLRDLAAS